MPVLEIVGGISAVSALLSQTITVIQQLRHAKEQVQGWGKLIEDNQLDLEGVYNTLTLVQQEHALQTPAVQRQISSILSVSMETEQSLEHMVSRQKRSPAAKFTHAFIKGSFDENKLESRLIRMTRLTNHLNTLILTTNVGISGDVQSGLTAAWPTITDIDEKVQKVLGQQMKISKILRSKDTSSRGSFIIL